MSDDKGHEIEASGPEGNEEPKPPKKDGKPITPELLEVIKRDPELIMEIAQRETAIFQTGFQTPFGRQLDGEQINKVLDAAEKNSERDFNYATEARRQDHVRFLTAISLSLVALFLILALAAIVVIVFKDKPEYIAPILTGLGGSIIGAGGGYGVGISRNRRRD